jgi:hypothetical protein
MRGPLRPTSRSQADFHAQGPKGRGRPGIGAREKTATQRNRMGRASKQHAKALGRRVECGGRR